MPRFSDAYIDRLMASNDYDALVQLQAIYCGWSGYTPLLPNYGFPLIGFVFVETLTWFSQALRSGAWTYYEATPTERQEAMFSALKSFGPDEYATQYKVGIDNWKSPSEMKKLDSWVSDNEEACNSWLAQLLRQHHHELKALYA